MTSYRVGVDGGGTTTRAVVIDENNQVLGRAQSGSSNLYNLGLDEALENIRTAVGDAISQVGITESQIISRGFGLAGVTGIHEKSLWEKALGELYRSEVVVDEDVAAALAGAFGLAELRTEGGAVLIAGTGANCFGQDATGQRARADGWGPLLGDRGSGFWLGEAGIRCAVAAIDGAISSTPLSDALLEHFAVSNLQELVGVVYAHNFARDRVAAFVPFVIRAARTGDEVAQQLLHQAGEHLAKTARAVLSPLEGTRLALVGGLIDNAPEIRLALAAALPGVELLAPRFDPVIGAALLPHLHPD